MLLALARHFESKLQHTIHPAASENRLLNGNFVIGSLIKTDTNVRILPFIVFAHDGEINFPGLPILQRRIDTLKKPYRPQIHVLPERAADRDQQSPKGNVIGHVWIADRSEKDGVKWTQLVQAVLRHHPSGFCIRFAAPVKWVPRELESKAVRGSFQHADAFRHYFFADTVARNYRNFESFHSLWSLSFFRGK